MTSISDIRIIELSRIEDPRGNLSFIESETHIPFKIARTYWIYDVPGGQSRGGHAYKNLHEFIVAISGSLDLEIDDGKLKQRLQLNRSYYGIYVPNGIWRKLENFSTNSLCMILSSEEYNADDYLRDYDEFLKLKNDGIL